MSIKRFLGLLISKCPRIYDHIDNYTMYSRFMDYKNLRTTFLEDKHTISILIYLYLEGRRNKSEIYQDVSKNPNMPSKLNELERLGLITQTTLKHKNNVTYIELTEEGKRYAEMLLMLEKRLAGDLKDDEFDKAIEHSVEQEVERRVAERIAEMDEDEISTSGAVLSVRDEEKEED